MLPTNPLSDDIQAAVNRIIPLLREGRFCDAADALTEGDREFSALMGIVISNALFVSGHRDLAIGLGDVIIKKLELERNVRRH